MIIDRRPSSLAATHACTTSDTRADDLRIVRRVAAAYQAASNLELDLGDSLWETYSNVYFAEIAEVFRRGDVGAAANILRNPGASNLSYGFDNSFADTLKHDSLPAYYATTSLDGLARFAEAIGAIALDNPESYYCRDLVVLDAETLLQQIGQVTGWKFSVPNPFSNEHGVATSRGVVSQRVPQALYQAWRIKQLVAGVGHPRILEIGAGLGRTAYYAHELGLTDYTIIDLPTTSISQGYFLGRTVGEEHVLLYGESFADPNRRIKIFPPEAFLNGSDNYDLVLNADSLTEMDPSVARTYWAKIATSAVLFLSINHEVNSFRVKDLLTENPNYKTVDRNPYWMRRGYVEELVRVR
jgi:hypothetical protein